MRLMLRLLGLVISIGLADSLNPTTIAPALYLSAGDKPRASVIEFTLSVFVVYFVGGALIAIGPGELIRSLVPHVPHTVQYIVELVVGLALLITASLLWHNRQRLCARGLPAVNPKRSSSVLLGATITAVELPTAFPYFAAIAAILASNLGAVNKLVLLLVFNVCFVLPLIGILLTVTFAGPRSDQMLRRARGFLERRWPHVAAILLGVVGLIAIFAGFSGFAARGHSDFGHFFRRARHFFHLHP
jgi:cytochrome c biogenesis protein CcdA